VLKERLSGFELGYSDNFVVSDGRKLLTYGDKLLTILNEHVKKHGRPQGVPDALRELEESLKGKPQVETPPNGVRPVAGKPNGTKVPSSSQRAGAGPKPVNDPRAKDDVDREWADLEEEIRALEGARK